MRWCTPNRPAATLLANLTWQPHSLPAPRDYAPCMSRAGAAMAIEFRWRRRQNRKRSHLETSSRRLRRTVVPNKVDPGSILPHASSSVSHRLTTSSVSHRLATSSVSHRLTTPRICAGEDWSHRRSRADHTTRHLPRHARNDPLTWAEEMERQRPEAWMSENHRYDREVRDETFLITCAEAARVR